MTKLTMKHDLWLAAIVRNAFSDYRKHNLYVSAFSAGQTVNSYWDGGSRNVYVLIHIATGERKPLPSATHPYYGVVVRGMANQSTPDAESDGRGNIALKHLPQGFALVQGGTFCGKPATAHVYLNPADMPKWLTDGAQ